MAQVLAGGGDQWINLWQGYHRLLQYFEHTNAKDNPRGNMAWYETEVMGVNAPLTEGGKLFTCYYTKNVDDWAYRMGPVSEYTDL